jgi:putative phosphoribosyl transferase
MSFLNRTAAGRTLGQRLSYLKNTDAIVLGLPRGGVPVAFEVAKAIQAPLDVIVVRKLGVPFQPELAMGAVGEGGILIRNEQVIAMAGITKDQFAKVQAREDKEVTERANRFREGRPPLSLIGRLAIIVDDGIATGSTALAACDVARAQGARKVLLAVPISSKEAASALSTKADEVISLDVPDNFLAVGDWYEDFSPVSDEEVIALLIGSHK